MGAILEQERTLPDYDWDTLADIGIQCDLYKAGVSRPDTGERYHTREECPNPATLIVTFHNHHEVTRTACTPCWERFTKLLNSGGSIWRCNHCHYKVNNPTKIVWANPI